MAHSLHTTSRGEGQPVVMLHSGGMSSRQWKKLGDVLATSHRVVAPDFLGSGSNPPWPEGERFDFTMDVEAVAKIVGELGQPVHLVGHSYGGLVAMTLARRSPGSVRSVAVYDPVAFGVLHAANDVEGLTDLARNDKPIFFDLERGGSDAWFEVFVDYWNGPGSWRAMPEPARQSFLQVGRKVFFEVYSLLQDRTAASAYAPIEAPALLLTGEASPAAAKRVAARLADSMPHGRLVQISGAGHMGPITHGAAVNEAIREHVASAS
ncbi:alpha/beta superfamily hydrolase [Labilithrix luteola]|uniref:Alpha/beta superfamily hydrolase n=1 Tax=Labilithrix luteola TaxID=1391654 RepID=A0A0K1PWT7_9BACT|nr:alpha/beta hydrolase [Labilithrix luteola]AKU97995.1 alpha/beta superfamily hydrolase [Labilithrix luteola]